MNRRDFFKTVAGGSAAILSGVSLLPEQAKANLSILPQEIMDYMTKVTREMTLLEYNDSFLRSEVENKLVYFLKEKYKKGQLYDFWVICNETNNTPYIVDNHQFVLDVKVKLPFHMPPAEKYEFTTVVMPGGKIITMEV